MSETAHCQGCTVSGVCGKKPEVSDVLVKNFGIAGIGTVDEDLKLLIG